MKLKLKIERKQNGGVKYRVLTLDGHEYSISHGLSRKLTSTVDEGEQGIFSIEDIFTRGTDTKVKVSFGSKFALN